MSNMASAKERVIHTLAADAFVSVNKKLLRHLQGDATAALMLGELISMFKYHTTRGTVDEITGYFPVSMVYLENGLGLSAYKQHNAIEKLQAMNLVSETKMGKPAGRFVLINFDEIDRIMADQAVAPNPTNQFYEKLAETATTGTIDELDVACDKMDPQLRGSIILVTNTLKKDPTISVRWTPKAVGTLKNIVRLMKKGPNFDYKRLQLAIDACYTSQSYSNQTVDDFITKLSNTARRVMELSPNERIYDWRKLV